MSPPRYGTIIFGASFEKLPLELILDPITSSRGFETTGNSLKATYFTASSDPSMESLVTPHRSEILEFAQKDLATEQPRDDYSEFLELSVLRCSCLWNSVSNTWRYALGTMDGKSYLHDKDVVFSCPVQEDCCRRTQHF